MKKLLLTLIVSFAFCGSIFAQYESYWPPITMCETQSGICAAIAINGYVYSVEDEGWDALEVAFFVDDVVRGKDFLNRNNVDWYGDPYPITNGSAIQYTNPGELVTFKLYDHLNQVEYDVCEVTYQGEPMTILTGPDHFEAWSIPPYDPIILNFTSNAITKPITGYNNGGGWYLISSPVDEVEVSNVDNLTINKFDLYYFDQQGDEFGKEWMNYELEDTEEPGFTTLELGKGYLYANEADVLLSFPGTAYTGEGTFPLEYFTTNEDETMHGWNLMGNPYNATATVNRPFYRMESDAFAAYDEGEIEPMEGVIVFAENENETVTFTPAETGAKASMLALNLSNAGKFVDRAIVGFGQGQRLPKFQFNNSAKVYITMDNKDYAIVRSEGIGEMPVSFKAENNGTYNLTLSSENVEFSYLHLIDNLTGADQDLLANPSYSFEASTTDYASRFRLVFATGNNEDSFAFFSNGNLVISNEGNATLQVVDVTGRIIMSENINGCASVNIDAAPGVYMVRLVNGDNMKVQKVVK